MKSRFFLIIILLIPFSVFSQTRTLNDLQSQTTRLKNNFYYSVITESEWRRYESSLDDLITEMDNYIKGGYGFSFDELNEIRKLRSHLNTMKLFGDGISVGGYEKMFNSDTKDKILEIFPEIRIESYSNFQNCVLIYKITFREYIVFSGYHREKGTLKEISWVSNSGNCITLGGSFNILWGVYKVFWNNIENCPNGSNPSLSVTGCEFVMKMDRFPSTVKPDF